MLAWGLLCLEAMSVYSPEYHAMVFSPSAVSQTAASTATSTATSASAAPSDTSSGTGGNQDEGFFHHLLDIVNPLQHLPVIGTIYRSVTGEHIGPVEKIAGDTLYGGIWGAVSSVADVAFEGITGKSVEDTVLAWFKGGPDTQVAKVHASNIQFAQSSLPSSDMPALPSESPVVASAQSNSPDVLALSASLTAKGITGDAASRAIDAYRRAIGSATQTPVFASLN
jgi:hypothetical protein